MTLLPNETIYSFLARCKLIAIHKHASTLYHSILGCSYTQTCGTTTYRLLRLSQLLDMDIQQLTQNHTPYPYFAHFMTDTHARILYEGMCNDSPQAMESLTGAATSRLSIPNYLAFCPKCAEDDITHYGVAYWHQEHILPGVSACHLHGIQLIRHATQPKILTLPDIDQNTTTEANDKEVLFARLSAEIQSNPVGHNPFDVIAHYKRQLAVAGYITPTGKVRSQLLLDDIRAFWRKLLHQPDFQYLRTNGKHHNFVRDIFRSTGCRIHPVKHILLTGFLRHKKPVSFKSLPATSKNRTKIKQGNEQLAIELLKQGLSLSQTSKQSKVSYYSTRKLACQNNITSQTKPRKLSASQEKEALNLLKQGLSMKKVGQIVGLSESGIDDLLLSHPELRAKRRQLKTTEPERKRTNYRKQALAILQNYPHLYRKALLAIAPEAFNWLRKNDREWLNTQLPPPQSAKKAQTHRYREQHSRWQRKQQQAIHTLRDFAKNTLKRSVTGNRLSRALILRSLGIRNRPAHVRERMPMFWHQLNRLAETHEAFQLRKLKQLYVAHPEFFKIYSALRLLKLARAFPPVSQRVLSCAIAARQGKDFVANPSLQHWLLLRKSFGLTSVAILQLPSQRGEPPQNSLSTYFINVIHYTAYCLKCSACSNTS